MKNKVIIVSTVGLIYDGITNIILSYLEAMDKNGLEIYVVSTIKSEPAIEKKFKDLGCILVHLPSRKKDVLKYFIELKKFIKQNKIQIIHAHGNSSTLGIEMVAALFGGCSKRIAHSHNTKCDSKIANILLKPIFRVTYTDALACSLEAGKWLFGNKEFIVLKNGREIGSYLFSLNERKKMRKELNLEDELVIGHVGGFFEQKNHIFLIEIFKEVHEIYPNSKLFLIGDGPLKKEIEENVIGNENDVKFIGTTDRVSNYLQAFDVMVMPSLFEGLPLVAIEWQINGLPCVISDTITKDCDITGLVRFESLENNPSVWANDILKMSIKNDRSDISAISAKKAKENGYDIVDSVDILRRIYLS